MKQVTIIRFSSGDSLALCGRCLIMMCDLRCPTNDDRDCVIEEVKLGYDGEKTISNSVGEKPPVYCDKCSKLLSYTLNE